MLKKLKIAKVFKDTQNKEGVPYVFKKGKNEGKPFTRVSIKTEETGDDVYSTCVPSGDRALTLDVGQEVLLKLSEKDGFKNFNFPSKGEIEVYEQLTGQN